ncbi:hypothetical protein BKA70DRAFT_89249 [Coprinopsis sp. MPI-PUGE-AT-0042]|nr:hypothetical protein BKA70DRAFT_89249 [Coprinopsis sp. MPI-PUGE-AT-0042]
MAGVHDMILPPPLKPPPTVQPIKKAPGPSATPDEPIQTGNKPNNPPKIPSPPVQRANEATNSSATPHAPSQSAHIEPTNSRAPSPTMSNTHLDSAGHHGDEFKCLALVKYHEVSKDYYCGTLNCGESFATDLERDTHYVDMSHGHHEHPSARYCMPCNLVYHNSVVLDTHRREEHFNTWCFTCSRDFEVFEELKKHMAQVHDTILIAPRAKRPSKEHTHVDEDRHIPCRVKGCDGMFKSPSGVAHHLESNTHPEIHRHTVTAVAQTLGIVPEISLNKRDALDASTITPLAIYDATEDSFDGQHFQCHICPKKFSTLAALHAHLNSPAHDDNEFKCPKEGCNRKFILISALVQHIESKTCGLTNMIEIQQWFDGLAAQFDRPLQ